MTRQEYEEALWEVSDEEWKDLKRKGLIPNKDSSLCKEKFKELMKREPNKDGLSFTFDKYEMFFMGSMDLCKFFDKFPDEAEYFMKNLD